MLVVRPALVAIALLHDAAAATTPGPKRFGDRTCCRHRGCHNYAGADTVCHAPGQFGNRWSGVIPRQASGIRTKSCCAAKSAAACDAGYRRVKTPTTSADTTDDCQEYTATFGVRARRRGRGEAVTTTCRAPARRAAEDPTAA